MPDFFSIPQKIPYKITPITDLRSCSFSGTTHIQEDSESSHRIYINEIGINPPIILPTTNNIYLNDSGELNKYLISILPGYSNDPIDKIEYRIIGIHTEWQSYETPFFIPSIFLDLENTILVTIEARNRNTKGIWSAVTTKKYFIYLNVYYWSYPQFKLFFNEDPYPFKGWRNALKNGCFSMEPIRNVAISCYGIDPVTGIIQPGFLDSDFFYFNSDFASDAYSYQPDNDCPSYAKHVITRTEYQQIEDSFKPFFPKIIELNNFQNPPYETFYLCDGVYLDETDNKFKLINPEIKNNKLFFNKYNFYSNIEIFRTSLNYFVYNLVNSGFPEDLCNNSPLRMLNLIFSEKNLKGLAYPYYIITTYPNFTYTANIFNTTCVNVVIQPHIFPFAHGTITGGTTFINDTESEHFLYIKNNETNSPTFFNIVLKTFKNTYYDSPFNFSSMNLATVPPWNTVTLFREITADFVDYSTTNPSFRIFTNFRPSSAATDFFIPNITNVDWLNFHSETVQTLKNSFNVTASKEFWKWWDYTQLPIKANIHVWDINEDNFFNYPDLISNDLFSNVVEIQDAYDSIIDDVINSLPSQRKYLTKSSEKLDPLKNSLGYFIQKMAEVALINGFPVFNHIKFPDSYILVNKKWWFPNSHDSPNHIRFYPSLQENEIIIENISWNDNTLYKKTPTRIILFTPNIHYIPSENITDQIDDLFPGFFPSSNVTKSSTNDIISTYCINLSAAKKIPTTPFNELLPSITLIDLDPFEVAQIWNNQQQKIYYCIFKVPEQPLSDYSPHFFSQPQTQENFYPFTTSNKSYLINRIPIFSSLQKIFLDNEITEPVFFGNWEITQPFYCCSPHILFKSPTNSIINFTNQRNDIIAPPVKTWDNTAQNYVNSSNKRRIYLSIVRKFDEKILFFSNITVDNNSAPKLFELDGKAPANHLLLSFTLSWCEESFLKYVKKSPSQNNYPEQLPIWFSPLKSDEFSVSQPGIFPHKVIPLKNNWLLFIIIGGTPEATCHLPNDYSTLVAPPLSLFRKTPAGSLIPIHNGYIKLHSPFNITRDYPFFENNVDDWSSLEARNVLNDFDPNTLLNSESLVFRSIYTENIPTLRPNQTIRPYVYHLYISKIFKFRFFTKWNNMQTDNEIPYVWMTRSKYIGKINHLTDFNGNIEQQIEISKNDYADITPDEYWPTDWLTSKYNFLKS